MDVNSYKPCSEGHKKHDNKCPYCVSVNGYKLKNSQKNKRRRR